ncbi:MAG: response regulator [Prolixibacteraceae bacterium]|nr:response regulator [Prolixibacteraceae bacterium]
MKRQNKNMTDAAKLRQKAEDQLKNQQSFKKTTLTEQELIKIIQELEIYQVELEMQNDELVTAKEKAELAEEKYSELYDFAPSGYISLTKDGRIVELNFVAARMLGTERSKIINKNFALFLPRNTLSDFNLFLKNIYTLQVKQTCELIIETEGNLPMYVTIDGIVSRNKEICLLTLIDITKRKVTENLLIEAKERAEESDRLKSAFLANMSHEIRTPMNGILGFAELLKEPKLNGEKQKKYIGIIEKSGALMLNTINNLIDISRIEAHLMKVEMRNSNINEQIEYIHTFFEPEANAKKIDLSFINSLPSHEAIIKTDREKVYAILTNLVKNAIKYSNKGSITFGYVKKGNELEFFVRDTGIGIPKDRQEVIFERFIQADNDNIKTVQGAGLGLAITKAFLEMLEGKIWVESEEGIGSTFYFTLPYNVDPEVKKLAEIVVSNVGPLNQVNPITPNLKILIAEDDEISGKLISIYLEEFCNVVFKATTGNDAVEICRTNPDLDLILMDIQMPGLNGYESTMQIRQFNKDVIIIAQTAFSLKGDQEKAITCGCNDYISKPINKAKLHSLIQKYFKQCFN